jgi:hypothetical protein
MFNVQSSMFYTLTGKRVTTPGKGLYILRVTTPDGKTISRKVRL